MKGEFGMDFGMDFGWILIFLHILRRSLDGLGSSKDTPRVFNAKAGLQSDRDEHAERARKASRGHR